MMVFGPMLAIAADPVVTGIQIEGASDTGNAWFSKTLTTSEGKETLIYEREEGHRDWHPSTSIAQAVTQLTHFGNQLVAVLPDGQWLFVGESTGQSLPARNHLIAIAGDASTLWAVGERTATLTSSPTTTTSGLTTATTTRPATTQVTDPVGLSVFQFIAGKWKRQGALPQTVSPASIALGLSTSRPVVAFADSGIISVLRLRTDGTWEDLGQQPAERLLPRKVIADGGHLFVYLAASSGADRLLVRSDHWLDPISLKRDAEIRSLGLAGGMLRYAYVDGQSIRQRSINTRTLQADSTDEEIATPEATKLQRIWGYLNWAMIGLVGLAVLHTYRQRDQYRKLSPDWKKVELAPFDRRIFAGMIDLMPLIAAIVYARLYIAHVEYPTDLLIVPQAFELLVWASGVYLAHTTVIETLAGRSLGKMVTRLQVVRLDGGKPHMGALAIRNLLRCVDLVLLFTPIFMLYLPLRQRVGDMAASTIVVANRDKDAPHADDLDER
jgi:uncharacterized RDD family membrane protein YckC